MRHVQIPFLVLICFLLAILAFSRMAAADQPDQDDQTAEVAVDIVHGLSAVAVTPEQILADDCQPTVGPLVLVCFDGQPAEATTQRVPLGTTSSIMTNDETRILGRILIWRLVHTSGTPIHGWICA